MTVSEFLIKSEVASNPEEVRQQITELDRPDWVCKKCVPETRNDLTLGQLIELPSIATGTDYMFTPARVILGIEASEVLACNLMPILALST